MGMLHAAGLVIERAEKITSGDETWLCVLARKPHESLLPPPR